MQTLQLRGSAPGGAARSDAVRRTLAAGLLGLRDALDEATAEIGRATGASAAACRPLEASTRIS